MAAMLQGSGTVHVVHAVDLRFRRRFIPRAVTWRRGMALPITVLVALAAATIAMVTLRQSYTSVEAAANRRAERTAHHNVTVERAAIETALMEHPTRFLDEVWVNEPPRICATAAPGSDPIPPGAAWPASCGWFWTYDAEPLTDGDTTVRVTMPSVTDPTLQIRIASQVDMMIYGQHTQYQPAGAGRWVLWSDSALDLSVLDQESTITGSIYSGGNITLPAANGATVDFGIVVAEGAVTGVSGVNTRRYGIDTEPEASLANPRRVVSTPESRHHLEARFADSTIAACADTGESDTATHSLAVCLRRGEPVPTVDETPVTVPTDVQAYLVMPGTVQGTLDIYITATPFTTATCVDVDAIDCDLVALADDAVNAGTHPALLAVWGDAPLTTVWWPLSGVVSADADVYVGLCGDGFTTTVGVCDEAEFVSPLTVLAGRLDDPRDVYVNGPIDAAGLQIVASGQIRIPFWSRPVEGVLNIDAHLTGLDITAIGVGVVAWPSPYPTAVTNQGDVISVTGSITGPELQLDGLGFMTVTVTDGVQSPWMVSAGSGWQRITEHTLMGAELTMLLDGTN